MSEEQVEIEEVIEEDISNNVLFEPIFYFVLIIIGLGFLKFIYTLYLIISTGNV